MKKFSILIASAVLSLSMPCITGCKTTSQVSTDATSGITSTNQVTTLFGQTITPGGIYSQFRGGTAQASLIALKADQNTLPYLRAVYQILEATISTGNYNPNGLQAALQAVPIKDIHNPAALEAITSGFAMFQIVAPILQNQVNGKNPFILPTLQGIADGINDALSLVSPPPAPVTNPTPTLPAPPAKTTTNAPTADVGSLNQRVRLPADVARQLYAFSKTGRLEKQTASLR